MPSDQTFLIASAAASVVLLILLIARWKLNAFIALIVVSLVMGVCAGMNLPDIAKSFGEGVGAVLGSIGMVVGLGAVLGKMLGESGGADVIAATITRVFGDKRLPWAVLFISLIVGLPVFFTVGVVLLTPIIAAISRRTGVSFLSLGLSMVAGLTVAHGLIPPHPGPMLAIETLHADAGRTILYSLIIGIPAAIVIGPVFSKFACANMASPPHPAISTGAKPASLPSFGAAVFTVALPIALMLLSTVADLSLPKENGLRRLASFIGHPLCALTISTLVSFYTFGAARGFNRQQILKFTEECVGPAANILLVVGAGGGFNRILIASGLGDVIKTSVATTQVSPLVLGWLVAALIRVATGSATVAISTAAGIVAPIAAAQAVNLELLVIAMGSGSLILSHLNDGGFWFVKEYLNLSVPQTLRTWTIMETIVALLGLAGALALNQVLKP
jgi:GntP family gluconate:H+ symporter